MRLLKFLWRGIGGPGSWLVLMMVIMANDMITSTEYGRFWFALCALLFYLALIEECLDKILEKLSRKEGEHMSQNTPHINDLRHHGYAPTDLDADKDIYPTTKENP